MWSGRHVDPDMDSIRPATAHVQARSGELRSTLERHEPALVELFARQDEARRAYRESYQESCHLQQAGWMVLRFWEHEDPESVADRVQASVRVALQNETNPGMPRG